jgi:hydrogenase maturation protein HypF
MGYPAHTFDLPVERVRVRVRGAVQGVGFRPFVWGLAGELGLSGWVLNDSEGVVVEVEGSAEAISDFLNTLETNSPPLARIDAVETETIEAAGSSGFEIRESAAGTKALTCITPDMATCDACLDDMFTPGNRRHLYAFTNCTHCGPRYTITHRLPYDRAETSMAPFAMCDACQGEYDNPADRRFHAQPNACEDCGPKLSMEPAEIADRLSKGEILAIKGLGGFHLAVDARNDEAVARLRRRKQRDGKPFAVMVANIESARLLACLSDTEEGLLTDRRRPVVVATARRPNGLSVEVSRGLNTLGLMLPYTPVHHLIFHAACGAPNGTAWRGEPQDLALIMTSANPGGEPLVTGNAEARERLGNIADAIVTHNRDIVVRCDDSVVRMINGAPAYLRRARGATPEPIQLSTEIPPTLAVGAYLKNTICVTRGSEAFVSQHIGDLDNAATFGFFRETIDHLTGILDVAPERLACDLHPDFLSSRYASETGLPLVGVQHHHAHIAATLAEHGLDGPHLGLTLDGFGLGPNGENWGGEILCVDGTDFERVGHLTHLRQPGGDVAARRPWRMGAAALHAMGRSREITERFAAFDGAPLVAAMLERGTNAPQTSSTGRLFDAACGLLRVRSVAEFEGEAPMALEALVGQPRVLGGGWRIGSDGAVDLTPLLAALLDTDPVTGAELFHGTLAAALSDACLRQIEIHDLPPRILAGGGCFQNRVLSEALASDLDKYGVDLVLPRRVPANDGGLSLGQAWVAALTDIETEDR